MLYVPFPTKVARIEPISLAQNEGSLHIHGKIYIIDGHTVYLGSLNFTESGPVTTMKLEFELRIRKLLKKIEVEFDTLYDHADLAFFGIEEWGKLIYDEPINEVGLI